MTKKEKELLTKVLCEQLPYGVQVEIEGYHSGILKGIEGDTVSTDIGINYPLRKVRPYLRPLSSMTEEEVKELIKVQILSKYGKEGSYCCLNNIKSIEKIHFYSGSNEWFCVVTFNTIDGEYNVYFAIRKVTWETTINEIDWLNKYHFDYRGLIEKDLAIAAVGNNNPY